MVARYIESTNNIAYVVTLANKRKHPVQGRGGNLRVATTWKVSDHMASVPLTSCGERDWLMVPGATIQFVGTIRLNSYAPPGSAMHLTYHTELVRCDPRAPTLAEWDSKVLR